MDSLSGSLLQQELQLQLAHPMKLVNYIIQLALSSTSVHSLSDVCLEMCSSNEIGDDICQVAEHGFTFRRCCCCCCWSYCYRLVSTLSSKKHVTASSTRNFLVHLLLRLWTIIRWFYFPTWPISCSYYTSGNCQDLSIVSLTLHCSFFKCYNTGILNAKQSLYYFKLTVCKRKITRFIYRQ